MKTRLAARVLSWTGLRGVMAAAVPWSGVLALNYHRIGRAQGSPFDHGLWSASAEDFDAQLRVLARHADIVTPADLPAVQRKARGRFAIVTFDDGYRDNFDVAFPILKRHGISATFFVTTGFLDRGLLAWWDEIAWMVRTSSKSGLEASRWLPVPVAFDEPSRETAVRALLRVFKGLAGGVTAAYLDDLGAATGTGRWSGPAESTWMTWDMVREMRRGGMVIGGHTVSHPVLARLAPDEQWEEIDGCRRRLLEELGEPMLCFSYPVGSRQAFDQDTRTLVARTRAHCAFSYYGGINRFSAWDNFDLRRVAIESHMDASWFGAVAAIPRVFGREQ